VLNRLPPAVSLVGIGWYFVVAIVGGTVGGLLLDGWLDTKPLFTMLGLFAGLAMAFVGAYRLLMEVISSQGKRKDADER